ncbi:hypothetical protein BS50DRAFT_499110 [Corynespora cassiicola Philippines]|uniref:Mediator of RNA polymerase II transcription subunit 4 n=1 Tax=Corynespora cassiicola Philippines TaxID=1448308 RepID=A0A2T2NH09_CORCC|nr:hypothetical protein BS50DRAFT_499110 [Corynespora cassiicola Philippines]
MDAILQAQFQRVEHALTTLVDSIASYNPSPQAAVDLVAADDELSRGLDQLALHQSNHARILALRTEAEALETQVKSSVATLAGLRRELFSLPSSASDADTRPVPFDELLQFAKNISKHTVPPTYREPIPDFPDLNQLQEKGKDAEKDGGGSNGVPSNGVNTPANPNPSEQPKENAEGEAEPKEITEQEAEWLRKLNENQLGWTPWPSNDKIRRGGLMQIQYLLDTGKDPAKIDISKLDDEEKRKMEEGVAQNAEQQAQNEPDVRRESVAVPPPAPRAAEPKEVFAGFGDFEDDED